ncbi:MAG: hypothetical protein J7639_16855 [Paenibacillaceae bacterium]|nr:hypothetical protein [Paenibacillaceae bacterium]
MIAKSRLFVCGLLLLSLAVPVHTVSASNLTDRGGDGIHVDDIVAYATQAETLSAADLAGLLGQIVPLWVPDAPTGLVAVAGDSAVQLTWAPVGNAAYYNVYRSSDGVSYQLISARGAVTSPAYEAAGLSNGTAYSFRVTAAQPGAGSGATDAADATPAPVQTAAEIADGITSVTAPVAGATQLTLPSVPPGFSIAILSSSNTAVIGTNGVIAAPATATSVDLVFVVTKLSDHSTANTGTIAVTVPASVPVFVPRPGASVNVALATNLGTVSASSLGGFPASSVIDEDRTGILWGSGGGWNDDSPGNFDNDTLTVTFNGTYTINEIDIITLRDNFTSPSEPTIDTTFSLYGITDYYVQYWKAGDVNDWVTIQDGVVANNHYVWRQFTFSPSVTTNKIRLVVTKAVDGYSRVVEVEAWTYVAPN